MKEKDVNLEYISSKLGVSITTVSRVLNGVGDKYRISKKTAEVITKTAKSLHYSRNNIARGLRLKKTSTIGLIVPDISNSWFAQMAHGIEKEARKHHYNIFFCNSDDNIEIEKKSVSLLQNWMVDGIIIAPIGLESDHLVDASKRGTPIVLIDRFFEGVDLPYIASNDFEGATEATQYLIDMGHKNIACIQGLVGTSSNSQRVKGYIRALKKNNVPLNRNLVVGENFGFENGYNYAKKIINELSKNKITAIFSLGNQITLGILKACKELKIQIPKDVSLVSFDEQNYSDLLFTPLTTVSHMNENVGTISLEMLFAQIEKNKKTKIPNTILESKLIIRDSVKKLA